MVYGAIGSTSYDAIGATLGSTQFATLNAAGLSPVTDSSLLLVGMAMLLIGFAFKVSAAPFHMWTPDVYQGAPTPIVGFMASAVKVAGFAGLLRVFIVAFGDRGGDWRPLLAALAVFSLLIGSFLAIVQTNVKRMLAYSSISHAGFMLIGVHATGSLSDDVAVSGARSVLFYMLSYTVVIAGTFAIITAIGRAGDGMHDLADYRGLSKEQPVLAGMLAILAFSMAGIPFTGGFFAKFGVILAAAEGEQYVLAGIAMLSAVVAAVLYLRIVVAMFLTGGHDDVHGDEADTVDGATTVPIDVPGTILLAGAGASVVTLLLGIWPGVVEAPLVDAAHALLGIVS
jgi:NADH-quinone oxidoreductase subunit N